MTPLNLLKEQISFYWNKGYKIHIHSNGDEGIQQVLDYVAIDEKENPRKDHRFTLHHMGYFSDAQAQQVKDLGMEASVNPYYLWALADKYSEYGLGKERGENLVRIGSLTKRGILKGAVYRINAEVLGRQSVKLLIYASHASAQLAKRLRIYASQCAVAYHFVESFGAWDYEINLEVVDAHQAGQVAQDILSNFGSDVTGVSTVPFIKTYKFARY